MDRYTEETRDFDPPLIRFRYKFTAPDFLRSDDRSLFLLPPLSVVVPPVYQGHFGGTDRGSPCVYRQIKSHL